MPGILSVTFASHKLSAAQLAPFFPRVDRESLTPQRLAVTLPSRCAAQDAGFSSER